MPEQLDHTSATLFKEHTADELHARLAPLEVTPRLACHLQHTVIRLGSAEVPAAMPETSPRLLERVREVTRIPQLSR